ncbi:MAG: hypothetical protein HYT98_05245 [Candidatus Sungbacteria bacterium]|nr:hypothetical protein [Candidatus Sungbacteria bacterium]
MEGSLKNESTKKCKKRAAEIIRRLKKSYPNAKIALRYSNNWELLVAVILRAVYG